MGCNNRCNDRCNSSLICGITNTLVKKLIDENCGEEEDKQDSACEATFATSISPISQEIEYSVTFSFNGGPTETFFNWGFYSLIDKLTLHPTAVGKAIFILNPDSLENVGEEMSDLTTLAGFTHDGFTAGDLDRRSILAKRVLFFGAPYRGPFSFSPEVNTLEIFPTLDVSGADLYNSFGGASLGGEPIVIKSCNALSLDNGDLILE